jgi:alkylresorcinol/alkylpyrone synthase
MDGKRAPPCSSADLLEEVALKTTNAASIGLDDIGALIVNTITGLRGRRWGARSAARYAQAMPVGSHVLFLTIDLCSLCLRIADPSMAMFVAASAPLKEQEGSRNLRYANEIQECHGTWG